jgi:SagB-type dehydrogenase family enzyme
MTDPAELPYVLAFREGVALDDAGGGAAVLRAGARSLELRSASAPLLETIGALASGGAAIAALAARAAAAGPVEQAKVLYYVERFRRLGWLTFTVACEGRPIATLSPATPSRSALPVPPRAGARYALSRFACLRPEGGRLALECPLGFAKTALFDARAAALFHLLAEPRTLDELGAELPGLPGPAVSMLVGVYLGSGAAVEAAEREAPVGEREAAGDRREALASWSPHDLAFHVRSRRGRHAEPHGATYPFRGVLEPLPALRPSHAGARVPLPRPEPADLASRDPPFGQVLEGRRSVRAYAGGPLRLGQLGEFLYRSARVRALHGPTPEKPYESSSRPHPGGGACHALEVYLVVAHCEGLAPGLYHYDPLGHALTAIAAPPGAEAALLEDARRSMGAPGPPHALVVLAARFRRLSWKYESIAYSILLKDVGALMQTMYLVATAAGLAPCAVGAGDSDLFADAAGLDYNEETSVGEFALGGAPVEGGG